MVLGAVLGVILARASLEMLAARAEGVKAQILENDRRIIEALIDALAGRDGTRAAQVMGHHLRKMRAFRDCIPSGRARLSSAVPESMRTAQKRGTDLGL